MRRLTIKNLSIQVDLPDTVESIVDYANNSIELINIVLRMNRYDLSAQIFSKKPTLKVEKIA